MLSYFHALTGLALVFIVIERIWPRVPNQPLFRKGWLTDSIYVVFNSKYAGVLLGYLSLRWIGPVNTAMSYSWLGGWPWWSQFVVFLLSIDLIKWGIHNLLHRVSWLWEFHKVHHSIAEMDWMGDWRFHWGEIIAYNALLYLPTLYLGVPADVALWVGIVDTLVGHFAHANLRWRIGWLTYVINSPQMHLWHHNHPDCGPINRNFGLTLSLWDWIFGTAYLPSHDPARLGFEGMDEYPDGLPGQWLAPIRALLGKALTRVA